MVLSNPRPHPFSTFCLVSGPSGPQLYGPLTYFPVIRPLDNYSLHIVEFEFSLVLMLSTVGNVKTH